MRIRKRAMPLPLSLLSPVPFSEPHLHLVQLPPQGFSHQRRPHSPPTDHPPPPPPPPPEDLRRPIRHDLRCMELEGDEDEKNKEQGEKGDDTSKQSISNAASNNGVLPPPSTPSNRNEVVVADCRWCDGEKAMPLKKRNVSFEMNGMVVAGEAKMKCKTNKILHNISEEEEEKDNDDDDEEDERNYDNEKKKKKKKKSKKGGSVMEGSRCSRVNGRGWRCLQPTLVGYSLCEHHLGKGRLRSVSNVRVRAPNSFQEESLHDRKHKNPVSRVADAGSKKRAKLGIVKARSLSSLLCQPETAVVEIDGSKCCN